MIRRGFVMDVLLNKTNFVSYATEFSIGNTRFNIFLAIPDENENESYSKSMDPVQIYHNHYYYELIFSSFADFQCTINDISFKVPKNNFLLFKAGSFHSTTLNPSIKANVFGFTFKEIKSATEHERTFDIYRKVFEPEYQLFSTKTLQDSFNQIIQRIQNPTFFSYYAIPMLLQIFFVQLAEKYAPPTKKVRVIGSLDYRIAVELNSLELNVTLKSLAQKLFISERQLERRIYKLYGMSFSEKRCEIRMNAAGNLLRTTDLTIEQIADRLYYGSPSSFIAAFKRHTGMTPTQYREE